MSGCRWGRVVAVVAVLVVTAVAAHGYRAAKADLADTREHLAAARGRSRRRTYGAGWPSNRRWSSPRRASAGCGPASTWPWPTEPRSRRRPPPPRPRSPRSTPTGPRSPPPRTSSPPTPPTPSPASAGSRPPSPPAGAATTDASATALRGASGACSRTLALATGARFPYDFADPYVLATRDGYFGYSTNAGAGDIQVIRSSDLVNWELVGNGLERIPGWASAGATWAPSVLARDGGYVVYYTVREASSGKQCISRGVASRPAGPFRDDSSGPLICQRELGGSIDPSPFVDADGRAYLLWKAEGSGGPAQTIWSQELTPDGLALAGTAHPLISADRSFERGIVEAPSMVREGGAYHLVYAAADWNSRHYATAVASCAGPAGPCTKSASGKVLASGARLAGPGGVEVFRDRDGALWAAFHAFSEPNVGYPASRYLYIARVRTSGGSLTIDAGT